MPPTSRSELGAVRSNQVAAHAAVAALVERHYYAAYRRPVAAHTRAAFARLDREVSTRGLPVVLDSGCGTGDSTRWLAQTNPKALVIGIDKSVARLLRAGRAPRSTRTNLHFVRADLIDFWYLARVHRWPVRAHYLLYPNPWPKKKHLKRRWHGHPALIDLVALGGALELRTNWRVYIEEFARALETLALTGVDVEEMATRCPPISTFERKYAGRGQRIYRLCVDLAVSNNAELQRASQRLS